MNSRFHFPTRRNDDDIGEFLTVLILVQGRSLGDATAADIVLLRLNSTTLCLVGSGRARIVEFSY